MRQITIISGKGGTGKTSICAGIATIAKDTVFVDCDVDAADLHLILSPKNEQTESFEASLLAQISQDKCLRCGKCIKACRFDAIKNEDGMIKINGWKCEGCSTCEFVCPNNAIDMKKRVSGEIKKGNTRFGTLFEGKLFPGEGLSGKMVSILREKARNYASEKDHKYIIVDGSPGIGCPVIASITGADVALIVTEPTPSGLHDLSRITEVCKHFGVPQKICINKHDLNTKNSKMIESFCKEKGLGPTTKIPYDEKFIKAMVNKQSIIEYDKECQSSKMIKKIWEEIK